MANMYIIPTADGQDSESRHVCEDCELDVPADWEWGQRDALADCDGVDGKGCPHEVEE